MVAGEVFSPVIAAILFFLNVVESKTKFSVIASVSVVISLSQLRDVEAPSPTNLCEKTGCRSYGFAITLLSLRTFPLSGDNTIPYIDLIFNQHKNNPHSILTGLNQYNSKFSNNPIHRV